MRDRAAQERRARVIRGCIVAVALLCMLASVAEGQSRRDGFGHHASVFGEDWGHVLSAPVHFNGNDWLLAGIAVVATASSWMVDEDVREWSQAHRDPQRDDWLLIGDYYGTGEVSTGVALLLYAGGEAFDDTWSRTTGRMVFQSMVYSEVFTHVMKAVIGRSRPYADRGNADFHPFTLAHERTSFPSGHSTAAFALATTLSRRIGHPAATVLLFTLAGVTVLQRIVSDSHWLSDTVLGAAIGTSTAWAVTELENRREREAEQIPPGRQSTPRHAPLLHARISF
ncbi:MAG: phosphatase PAP2 family protein [Bacteroidia bacterium]|nr:phosphatase PAP2 family protein [Bacteroidia bacterium]